MERGHTSLLHHTDDNDEYKLNTGKVSMHVPCSLHCSRQHCLMHAAAQQSRQGLRRPSARVSSFRCPKRLQTLDQPPKALQWLGESQWCSGTERESVRSRAGVNRHQSSFLSCIRLVKRALYLVPRAGARYGRRRHHGDEVHELEVWR